MSYLNFDFPVVIFVVSTPRVDLPEDSTDPQHASGENVVRRDGVLVLLVPQSLRRDLGDGHILPVLILRAVHFSPPGGGSIGDQVL